MFNKTAVLIGTSLLAVACGGGDHNTPTAPTPTPAAPAPVPSAPVLQTIAEFLTINVDTGPIAVGQSVTVSGGLFANLRFRFGVPSGFETATGSLFLLDREYLGTTTALGAATAGVLASTSRIENGDWVFEPGVTIRGGTKYWFVTTSNMRVYMSPDVGRDFYTNGEVYSGNDVLPFRQFRPSPAATIDASFQLRGSAASP
jgi:hypothetical protein